jgi:nanoRNase/pAp phosphatase (c-di-AMP/oligoRNAs hydrolase)
MPAIRSERLRRFYDIFSGEDQVLIGINADPDAIASAMAVRRLLWRKVVGVTIACTNVIKRPDNLTMLRLLGIRLFLFEEIEIERFSKFVIVDSQPSHDDQFNRLKADVIIDHHPDSGETAAYTDIRPAYGATASIMTEYLRTARIKPSSKLATGLFYAIKTDTDNFERKALFEDVKAFQFLFRHVNIHMARRIEQSELKFEFLKYFKIALEEKRRRKGKIYAHLGNVPSPDVCVLVADFFMRVSSVSWSIVSGRYNKKLVVIFRNDGIRKNAGKLASISFGQIGSAGGHKNMARAEIAYTELKQAVDTADDAKMALWVIRNIEKPTKKPKPANIQKDA